MGNPDSATVPHPLDTLAIVEIGSLSLSRFEAVLSPEDFSDLHAEMQRIRIRPSDRRIWNVSSAGRGGGVAEMLASLLGYARGASVVFAANSRHIQYAACKASLGAAILPCLAADHDPDLIQLLPPERVRSIDLWLVAHQDLSRTARVRAVLDFLADIVPRRTQSSR